MTLTPFHIAVPVRGIAEARVFYTDVLGLSEGRSSDEWIDFNLFGHQFGVHLDPSLGKNGKVHHHLNPVDEKSVPIPHYGVVLNFPEWQQLADRLKAKGIKFLIEPYIRFKGQIGEQGTMFFSDPSGNALEFKAFRDIESELFAN